MSWKNLFFSFDGRISRRQWWLAMVPLLLISLVISFLANPLSWFSETVARKGPNLAETLFDIAFLIPQTAIMVKRFNDRDWPQWLPFTYAIAFLVFTVLDYNRLILSGATPTATEIVFLAALFTISLIIIFENGFMRGTRGANRYGPDPLGGEPADDPARSTGGQRR